VIASKEQSMSGGVTYERTQSNLIYVVRKITNGIDDWKLGSTRSL
tara:strand:+ start:83 stop:217 length:135 start_codon:yes stop_codon:yes gene_type:complete